MSETLLRTKLNIPPLRPQLVPRPTLIDCLNQGVHQGSRLTLVSAPAGFGKTTLLSEWAGTGGAVYGDLIQFAWLSLDKGDNDPARFLAYFIGALQTIWANIGDGALALLQSPESLSTEMILAAVINEITEVLSNHPEERFLALVLDDYHVINAQPVHDALSFLLDHLLASMQLAVASRTDPPLPLPRLRIRGQLVELREADLRFTLEETAALFNQALGLALSAEDVVALDARTEGWIAGLQVAGLSMRGIDNVSGFIDSFSGSHRYILDYLVEEVLNRQPEKIQSFLLRTAILDQMTSSLCEAVTEQAAGQATLERLERHNLFVIPLDDERRWYRYHHLFADLLRARLYQSPPEMPAELHRRASDWYEQNGFTDEATNHALAAKDYDRAAQLIENLAEDLWQRGQPTSMLEWLEALPDEQIASRPSLCNFFAWALYMNGQNQSAELWLQTSERALESGADSPHGVPPGDPVQLHELSKREQRGRAAAIRAAIASRQGDVPGIFQFSGQALQYLSEDSLIWRTITMMALGFAQDLGGDTAAAYETFAEAVRLSEASGNIYLILSTNLHLGTILIAQGRLKETHDLCRELLVVAGERKVLHTEMAGCLYDELGLVLCEWNELDEAMRYLEKGANLSKQGYDIGVLGWSYLTMMRALYAQGDVAGAVSVIQKMERMEREADVPPWYTNPKEAWKARLWLKAGNLRAASQWALERGLKATDVPPHLREEEYVALAQVLVAQGQTEEALGLSERLLEKAKRGGRNGIIIRILIIQALARRAMGDIEQALTALERALALGEPGGGMRVFLDEGPPMAELLRALSDRPSSTSRTYLDSLLAAFAASHLATEPAAVEDRDSPGVELVEPLSDREVEVLRLLAAGLTYREIAEELYVSINTVKAHAKNIYSKLGAHGRMQAAQRAKELNLI